MEALKAMLARHLSVRWGWVIAWSFAGLVIAYGVYGLWRNYNDPPGVDFVSFWAAGKLALAHKATLAYDIDAHRAVELTAGKVRGIMSFPYPPPTLLFFAPLSLLPFFPAFALWVIGTCAFYIWAARNVAPPPQSLAIPSAIPNMVIGQNGLLFTGLFIVAAEAIERRPILAGLLFGVFAVKPQLGFLIPVALIAGSRWRTLFAAGGSAIALYLAGLIVFGPASYLAFLNILPHYQEFMARSGWQWNTLASVFAFLRWFDVPQQIALTVQTICAAGAAIVTWLAWRRGLDCRIAVLASASMLVSPYLFTYDTMFMTLPFVWLLRNGNRYVAALVWILCLLPFLAYSKYYSGPNTIAIAAVLSLWAMMRQESARASSSESAELKQVQAIT